MLSPKLSISHLNKARSAWYSRAINLLEIIKCNLHNGDFHKSPKNGHFNDSNKQKILFSIIRHKSKACQYQGVHNKLTLYIQTCK